MPLALIVSTHLSAGVYKDLKKLQSRYYRNVVLKCQITIFTEETISAWVDFHASPLSGSFGIWRCWFLEYLEKRDTHQSKFIQPTYVTRLKLNLGFTDVRLSSLHYPYSPKEYWGIQRFSYKLIIIESRDEFRCWIYPTCHFYRTFSIGKGT